MKNIKVGVKLIASYILVAIIAVAVAVFMLSKMSQINDQDTELYEKGAVPLGQMTSLVRSVQLLRITVYEMSLAQSPEEIAALKKTGDSTVESLIAGYKEQREEAMSDRAKTMCDKVTDAIRSYQGLVGSWMASVQNGTAEKIPGTNIPAVPQDIRAQANAIAQVNDAYIQEKAENAKRISDGNTVVFQSARQMSIVLLVLMALVAVGFGIVMTRGITGPLHAAVEALAKCEKGDLTVRVELDQKDEFGQEADSINNFLSKIQTIIKDMKGNAEELAGS
jgi:methyl-accepting chemotaxis protein